MVPDSKHSSSSSNEKEKELKSDKKSIKLKETKLNKCEKIDNHISDAVKRKDKYLQNNKTSFEHVQSDKVINSEHILKETARKESEASKQLSDKLKLLQLNEPKVSNWKFWSTQPVSMDANADDKIVNEPIQENYDESMLRKDSIPLPDGFSWSVINVDDDKELLEVYILLNENYVQDDDNMFRFDYGQSFLKWALCPPEWTCDWHVGIRASKSNKLLGFISGVPATIQIRGKIVKAVEINFLCVHKQLRAKRMAPVLIKEITRRANLKGIYQAVYTSGTVLPGMIGKCRYWHRSLNVKKLVEINFSYLSPLVTLQRSIRLHRLPKEQQIEGFRVMEEVDIPQAHILLSEYLQKFALSPVFTLEEFKHNFSNRSEIVSSFVIAKPDGTVTDFASFYHLSSSILQHPNYKKLNAAYSFYTVAKETSLIDLVRELLIAAVKMGFDVFNALDSMDNGQFLEELKFGIGDGDLHYYLYNWRTGHMQSNQIGLTLL